MSELIDVLILTAIREEFEEAQEVNDGAVTPWARTEQLLLTRSYLTDRGPLRVGLTLALDMRGVSLANAAHPIIHKYQPQCLAMCGVCAGRRGHVRLGDVIIGDPLYVYDAGALTIERTEDGEERSVFRADPNPHRLSATWRAHALEFRVPQTLADRALPISLEEQRSWLLSRLANGLDPVGDPQRETHCPQWTQVLDELRQRGLLEPLGLTITALGRQTVAEERLRYPDGLPKEPLKIHLGAIATGENVVRYAGMFDRLSYSMRNVLGLDMEAAALGAVAHDRGIPSIAMKAVMDYADGSKTDAFKRFAARASADCLLAFLRQVVEPRRDLLTSASAFEQVLIHMRDGLRQPEAVPLQTTSGEDAQTALAREAGSYRSTLLLGAGGAGKSTAVRSFADTQTRTGTPCLLIRASSFMGDIDAWTRSGLPLGVTADALEADALSRHQHWFLVIDGLNECAESRRRSLMEGLAELLVRYRQMHLVCTSRARDDLAPLQFDKAIEFGTLDDATRERIFRLHVPSADARQLDEARSLKTPLDLTHAAAVWGSLAPNQRTHFGVRDAFVRRRLQHDVGGQVHEFLRAFANELFKTASLSMSTDSFVRWFERTTADKRDANIILSSTLLLEEVGGATGFVHESLLDYFMASYLLRGSTLDTLVNEIDKPRFRTLSSLLLEAQAEMGSATRLLSSSSAAQGQMFPMAQGEHGALLREIAEGCVSAALDGVTIGLKWNPIENAVTAAQPVSSLERAALICAAELAISDEAAFRRVLVALDHVDATISAAVPAFQATLQKTPRQIRSVLYGGTFWIASSTKAAFLVQGASPGRRRNLRGNAKVWDWSATAELTPAGAMFVAEALRYVPPQEPADAHTALLHRLVDTAWSIGWSHLRLAVLDLLHSCGRGLPAASREALRIRIAELPDQGVFLNSSLFEALEALGEEIHIHDAAQVGADLAEILTHPRSPEMQSRAYGLFSRQFEMLDALSRPVTDAIEQLDPEARSRFHVMAALGASEDSLHADFAIDALGACGTAAPDDDALLHDALRKWAEPPSGEFGKMPLDPSERAANFLLAHERLARCGHQSPVADSSMRGRVWGALASIVIGHCTNDPTLIARSWNDLQGELSLEAWEPLSWTLMALRSGMHKSVPQLLVLWPNEMAKLLTRLISRRADWHTPQPYHQSMADMALDHFVSALGEVGGHTARALLVEFVDLRGLGETARSAIRRIDSRALSKEGG